VPARRNPPATGRELGRPVHCAPMEADYTAFLAEAPFNAYLLRTRSAQGEACRAFAAYVRGDSGWRSAPRKPSSAIFAEVFPKPRVSRRRRPKVAEVPVTSRARRPLEACSATVGTPPLTARRALRRSWGFSGAHSAGASPGAPDLRGEPVWESLAERGASSSRFFAA
jgi:hypothetical protein